MAFLITCEHGSNQIPNWLTEFFVQSPAYDLGALDAAKHFARLLRSPLIAADYSPAVADVNRSLNQRGVFSSVTRNLPKPLRQRIAAEIHEPYRMEVETAVERLLRTDQLVIHLSVHSFATFEPNPPEPAVEDRSLIARRTDLGLLYDPAREYELALCMDWLDDLYYTLPMLRVRRNYPRRGTSESLIRSFRQKYAPDSYLGIELQLNRAWCVRDVPVRKKVFSGIAKSLIRICEGEQEEQEAA